MFIKVIELFVDWWCEYFFNIILLFGELSLFESYVDDICGICFVGFCLCVLFWIGKFKGILNLLLVLRKFDELNIENLWGFIWGGWVELFVGCV